MRCFRFYQLIVFLLILPSRSLGDEGDLIVETVVSTSDTSLIDLDEISLSFVGGHYPVGIQEDGGVSFCGKFTLVDEMENGRYRVNRSGGLEIVTESGNPMPGVSYETKGNASSQAPIHATGTSPSGRYHAVAMRAEKQNQVYLYLFDRGTPGASPVIWSNNGSLPAEGAYQSPLLVQDGRGTEEAVPYGAVPTMLVSDFGTVFWENRAGLFSDIFRAGSASGVKAVVFENTPAPGFSTEANANFTGRNKLIGVDNDDNAYFFAEVQTTGGRIPSVYRQNGTDSTLTLIFESRKTPLPGEGGAGPYTATVALDDCAVKGDGTVYLRAPLGSTSAGFWKVGPDGVVSLLGLFSEFTDVNTNQGTLRFRNIDDADWGILNGDQIVFSSDVRSGVNGTNEEGVWILDPASGTVRALVRAPLGGSYGELPGTEATFLKARNIVAAGEGYVAFLAQLSDGKTGLFATDPSGGLVKIALEGESLNGKTITKLHFTPDAVGERVDDNVTTPGLRGNCGTAGLNSFGEIAFAADLPAGERVIVRTSFEGNRPPGDVFVWDGGAGDENWHSINGGRSNWADENGVGRDQFPPTDGSAEVRIETEAVIYAGDAAIDVKSLTVTRGILELETDFVAESLVIGEEASLVLDAADLELDDCEIRGVFSAEGEGKSTVEANKFFAEDVVFSVESGELEMELNEGRFKETPIEVGEGHLTFSGLIILEGEDPGISVNNFEGKVTWESGTIRLLDDAVFEAGPPASLIRWGGDTDSPIGFEVAGEKTLEIRGAGRQEVRKSLEFPLDMTLKNLSDPTPSGEGFVIDLEEGEKIEVAGKFESEGVLTIYGGELRTKDFGFVTIGGECVIEEPMGYLDGSFSGTLVQLADVDYGAVRFGEKAVHRIRNAGLNPAASGIKALYYNFGSKVEVFGEGACEIEFDRDAPGGFDAPVLVGKDCQLTISGAVMDVELFFRTFTHTVEIGGELEFENFRPTRCRVIGGGMTRISGEIEPSIVTDLSIETELFEMIGANVKEPAGGVAARPKIHFIGKPQEGVIRDCLFGKGIDFIVGEKSVVVIDGPLTLASQLVVRGIVEVKADIQDSLVGDGGGLALVSAKVNNGIVIPANLPQPIEIGVPITFGLGKEKVFVGSNSTLVLTSRALSEVVVDGILQRGVWEMALGSRCQLTTPDGNDKIFGLGEKATLKLKSTAPRGKIFGDLPSFAHPFSVGGTLELDGTLFDMGGGTLYNRKQIQMKNGAKVIGDVESIRDDVQGVVPLAGNFVIEGNLTSGGIISLGASPGSGVVTGDLILLPESEMIVEFEGTKPGTEFDYLEVGGEVVLDGKLTLKLLDEYLPPGGEVFEIVTGNSVTGTFSEIDQSEVGRSRRFAVNTSGTAVEAEVETIFFDSFGGWRGYFFTPEDQANDLVSGPSADPDGDGKDNLMEYATNGLPMTPDPDPLVLRDGVLSLRWANGVNDVIWDLSTSTGLETWETADHSSNLLKLGLDSSVFELEVDPALAASPERYYQIRLIWFGP